MLPTINKNILRIIGVLAACFLWSAIHPSPQAYAAPNQPPVVNAGADQTITLPTNFAQLTGIVTDDGLPFGILQSSWTTVGGPAIATFDNDLSTNTIVYFPQAGTYVLQLFGYDGEFADVDTVTIVVNVSSPAVNQPPVVNAGIGQNIMLPTNFVMLSGSITDDGLPSGILTTTWSKISGPGTVTFDDEQVLNTRAHFSAAGDYVLLLIGSDGALSDASTTTVRVNPSTPVVVNQPPVVNAGIGQTIILPTNSAMLSGSISDDGLPSGILTTTWSLLSGPAGVAFDNDQSTNTLVHFTAVGDYVFLLIGSDGALTDASTTTVRVNPSTPVVVNQPPVVNAGIGQTIMLPINTATLSGSITDDGLPSGILTTMWSLLSGPATVTFDNDQSTNTIVHFTSAGDYVLLLTGTDGVLSDASTTTVRVNPSTPVVVNQPPVVNAGIGQTIMLPINTATLSGSITDDGLPSGILTTMWSLLSGPATVTFDNDQSTNTIVHFTAAGEYVLLLTGSDGVLSDASTTTVRVNLSTPVVVNQPPVVNAGADRTITSPVNTVFLAGSVTDDGLPSGILTFNWTIVSGPGVVTFDDATSSATIIHLSSTGTYVIRLQASDGALSASDLVTITFNGLAPISQPALDPENVIQPGSQTIIRGNGSGADDAKIIFHTNDAGRVTFYVYERSMGMKSMEMDGIQGDNEIRVKTIRDELDLTWGVYYVTIKQNGKVLKRNMPLALIP
jgi:hypothetical protein